MNAAGFSQSELARRVGVSQPTIYKLLRSSKKGSTHLHRIARELGTTPAYLAGEIDDPDAGAPPPPPAATAQVVMLPVALPAQPALAAMFRGLIQSLGDSVTGDELADELASLLPIGLAAIRGPLRFEPSAPADAPGSPAATVDADAPARKRA